MVRRLRMFLVSFFCPLTFFYRVDAATTALVLLKETRRTINTCSCLFMFSNTLLTQRECLHALYTLTLARVMDFFPHLTSVLAALATSATIASLLQQPVGFKKKKKSFFKFLLFPPILLLWLTAYYYWQYFNVYVALRCGCGAV